jgi:gp45 sliding clamp, C terminal
MKLSPDTVSVLKNFAGINQSLIFPTNKQLGTIAESKTILAQVKIDEEFPREFGIYDLNEFLSTLGLFGDPDLNFEDSNLAIKDSVAKTRSSCKYFYADVSMIPEFPNTDKILKAVKSAEIKFDLSEEDLERILKAAGTLQSKHLAVESDGKKILLSALDAGNATSNKYSIEVAKGTGAKFRMLFKTDSFKLLKGGYEVRISKQKISQFKHSVRELTYWIALEDESTYEE